eukprot:PhF_6_TR25155/c0_g1_i1/m.34661
MEQQNCENIKSIARIRPILPKEHNEPSHLPPQLCIQQATLNTVTMNPLRINLRPQMFTLNAVYGPRHTTDSIYEADIRPLIHSVVNGYNASIIAYGQTGSGKTYTMSDIVPLAVTELFAQLRAGDDVAVSFVEVYNETLRDLIA